MAEKVPESSDAQRSARPLKYAYSVTFREPLPLENGGSLAEVTVAYETWGELSPQRDNAVFICHALSGDSHVAQHDAADDAGWWDILVGPGCPVDTKRFFVICANVLGGCRGTTGPGSIDPATGQPYGGQFPLITIGDIVNVHSRLVAHLGITRLHGVLGGSMGGHMAMDWSMRFPDQVGNALVLASSAYLTAQSLAFDIVGRNAILRDPNYANGQYYAAPAGPATGLALARMLAHITYLSRESMSLKFASGPAAAARQAEFESSFAVGSYLVYQGDRFVERFDANSYIVLTRAMDQFDLGRTPEQLAASLARTQCRWLVISYSSDWLFPPFQSAEIVHALARLERGVTYANIQSPHGHDAFLLKHDLARYGELVRAFLAAQTPAAPAEAASHPHQPTSIFHDQRVDYDTIVELIAPGASVLDLGCGVGGLLERLAARGHARLVGVELDELALVACARRSLDVIHADVNVGLPMFHDGQFDVVVLSQTLQTVRDVNLVLDEMLRVGRTCIVSFPNLAYAPLRRQLLEQGRAPRGTNLLGASWHETHNIRFLSIADFEDYCRLKGLCIRGRIALDTTTRQRVTDDPNLNADLAVFLLTRA